MHAAHSNGSNGRPLGHACMPVPKARVAPCFVKAREVLSDVLQGFVFARVVQLTDLPAANGRPAHYYGEAQEVSASNDGRRGGPPPRRFFFERTSRARGGVRVAAALVADAPLGFDHPSSTPQVGEILMGTATESTRPRSRCTHFIAQWACLGRPAVDRYMVPVMEVSRLVNHGTRATEVEVRALLTQGAAATAKHALAMPPAVSSLPPTALAHVQAVSTCADDLWVLLRVVLWGNVRLLAVLHQAQNPWLVMREPPTAAEAASAAAIVTSMAPQPFVETLSTKLQDHSVLQHFWECFDMDASKPPELAIPEPAPTAHTVASLLYSAVSSAPFSYSSLGSASGAVAGGTSPYAPGGTTPMYATGAMTPMYAAAGGTTPMYAAAGGTTPPMYEPYVPSSPVPPDTSVHDDTCYSPSNP